MGATGEFIARARSDLRKAGWSDRQIDVLLPMRERVNPHNLDAEASILGGIFLRNEILRQLPSLEVEDFYSPKHQIIFAAIRNLEATAKPIDPITVEAELDRQGKLESIGGLAYLGELTMRVPSVENVIHYAETVKELRTQVVFIQQASEILEDSYRTDLNEFRGPAGIQRAITRLMSIPTRSADTGRSVGQLMREELEAVEKDLQEYDRVERSGERANLSNCIPTGITGIDLATGGFPVGMVASVLGGSGHGKSTVAGNSAEAAVDSGCIALIYPAEDIGKFWGQRSLARASGVPTEQIVRRRFDSSGTIRQLFDAMPRTLHRNEVVVPCSNWTMEQIVFDARSRFHRLEQELGPLLVAGVPRRRKRVVYIDYVQVLRLVFPRGIEKKTDAIGIVMNQGQWLAQGCGSDDPAEQCAVVFLSQVKGEVTSEQRAPTLNDAADSPSNIKNVSKYMLGINRPAKYDANADPLEAFIDVLKYNQGDDTLQVKVMMDLARHTILDARDQVTYEGGRTHQRWAGPDRLDNAPPIEDP